VFRKYDKISILGNISVIKYQNMIKLTNSHHTILTIQWNSRVVLLEVNRSKGDPQNILFVIVSNSIIDNKYYELGGFFYFILNPQHTG
jgi:hypothetical protein